jgi:glyoxylase-like metal-dependent hydrolase (beta-lactamase superfamily II)
MKEILPSIFLIKEKGAFGAFKPRENIYVFSGHDGVICDAGYGNKRAVKKLVKEIRKIEEQYKAQNKPFKITRVLVSHSHPDHFSGLELLRRYLGVKVVLTKKTAEIIKNKETFVRRSHPTNEQLMKAEYSKIREFLNKMSVQLMRLIYTALYGINFFGDPDEIIDENSEILINGEVWRIFPSPGHASDHISLYNEEKGILFSGDNILRVKTTWLGPPNSDLRDYMESLEYTLNLPNLRIILSSHGRPIENPRERVKTILDNRRRRTEQVRELVQKNSETGITPKEIIKSLYPKENKIKQEIARGWIVLTLKYLEEENLIRREVGKKEIRFFPYFF